MSGSDLFVGQPLHSMDEKTSNPIRTLWCVKLRLSCRYPSCDAVSRRNIKFMFCVWNTLLHFVVKKSLHSVPPSEGYRVDLPYFRSTHNRTSELQGKVIHVIWQTDWWNVHIIELSREMYARNLFGITGLLKNATKILYDLIAHITI